MTWAVVGDAGGVKDIGGQWWRDDEELLALLDDALRAARAVPGEFIEAGNAAYAWHDIDAELAALIHDSAQDEGLVPATRAAPADLRSLTFCSAELTIEIELTGGALVGQIVPPQPGQLEVRTVTGSLVTVPIDEIGCFVIRPVPTDGFWLHCRTAAGTDVQTSLIRL
jgi:hypothetical protein